MDPAALGGQLSAWLLAGVFVPLVMFAVLALCGSRIGKPGASVPAIAGILISLLCGSVVVCKWWIGLDDAGRLDVAAHAFNFHWATLGDIQLDFGVKLDSLTVAVYFMVGVVSSCIFIFSRGYMAGHSDEVDHVSKYHRFFCFLSLFAFSMLGLVISSSLVFLFIFWELVGVCSYFLIGFYFDKKFASDAAIKAFVTNRVGDFGFIIGLGLVALYLGDLSIDGAAAVFDHQWSADTGLFERNNFINLFGWDISGYTIATFMGVCLFCGCIGKSAQVPLQVWLPDAMAGPTPVSALIHAATMVAAGVYLVARIFPLLTPDAQFVIAVIGCVTLTMAALIAIVQTDIKKALAYSTLSQLGYMVFGMGVGAWIAALFHLITHAFFKAMLFLCSGQVIEGCHHQQDMRKMGGLLKKMPVTGVTCLVGVLAISGVGLPAVVGIPALGVGGYYSKDEIIAVAYYRAFGGHSEDVTHEQSGAGGHGDEGHSERSPAGTTVLAAFNEQEHTAGTAEATHETYVNAHLLGSDRLPRIPKWLVLLAIFTAYVTPFYMMRLWWLTFMGKPRDQHVHDHAHEVPWMYVPLIILAIGTFWSSHFLFRPLIADASLRVNAASKLVAPLDGFEHLIHHTVHGSLTLFVWPSFLVGFILAIAIYRRGLGLATSIARLPGVSTMHTILVHKFYFDEVYNTLLVGGVRALAAISGWLDKWVLDFTIIENLARIVKSMAMVAGRYLDARGVDKAAEGLGESAFALGDVFRLVQTGRIRNYVLFSATSVLIVMLAIFYGPDLIR